MYFLLAFVMLSHRSNVYDSSLIGFQQFLAIRYTRLYLRRHPQSLPLGLWVTGWKQHCGNLLSLQTDFAQKNVKFDKLKCLFGLLPILLGHHFRLQLGNMGKDIGSGGHSLTFEWHSTQKYGSDREQTAEQAEHKLSVSELMLASMQSLQLVSEAVDNVGIDDVCIELSGPGVVVPCLQMLHCSWQLAGESSSNKTVWHGLPKFISMRLLLNTDNEIYWMIP